MTSTEIDIHDNISYWKTQYHDIEICLKLEFSECIRFYNTRLLTDGFSQVKYQLNDNNYNVNIEKLHNNTSIRKTEGQE